MLRRWCVAAGEQFGKRSFTTKFKVNPMNGPGIAVGAPGYAANSGVTQQGKVIAKSNKERVVTIVESSPPIIIIMANACLILETWIPHG